MKFIYELKQSDIGKDIIQLESCQCCGVKKNPLYIRDLIGKVYSFDVGKRIYDINGVYYIENDQQLNQRRSKNE